MSPRTLTIGAAVLVAASAAAQPPNTVGSRVISGPPLSTLPPPGLPSDTPSGSALRPWLTPPAPARTSPAAEAPPARESSPSKPAETPPAAPLAFDTGSLRVRRETGRWQLWAGATLLKDFGPAERDAFDALQTLRDLRVNSRGAVGGVFEYWLADGQAPAAINRHRLVVPFDPASLRVEQVSGQWVLRDARVILYTFGPSRTDAQQALAVCRKYGFNQLGYVGHPTPALKYLMKDPNPSLGRDEPASVVPASARMTAAEASYPRLVVPGAGDVGDRVPFDVRRLDLRREGGEWVLYAGRTPIGRFGASERQGQAALAALQQFRVTELCRVGDTGFGFFLTNGRAPQGTIVGLDAKPLRPEALAVRQVGGTWAMFEGQRVVAEVGDRAEDARHALAAIRAFRFDHVIPVGSGRLRNVNLFVRANY